jgi:hypothetical protein
MPIQVTIGGVPYNIPVTGERGWGDDSTDLLERLALEANEFATGVYNLTSDIDLNDVFGLFGIRANFYKGKGNIPDDGFLRIAHPDTESSQPYIFTKITWRNTGNDANLALFPTDNEFLEFAGVALANVSGTQTFTNKTATDLVLDNEVSGSAIITDVALAGAADTLLASSLAIKTYVDNAAAGQDDASEITYTPASNPDWDTVPAFVAPALDELASRVKVNEADIDTAETNITNLGNDKADKAITIATGAGLSGGGDLSTSHTFDVNVDNSSIEIDFTNNTVRIKDDGVTSAKILNDAVITTKILDANVTTPKIADNAVTAAKLDGSVAGAGLVLDGGDNSINVNVDGSTLEIDTDQVRIADDGVVTAKIADEAVTSDKLADGSVITAKIANLHVTNDKLASDIDAGKLASGTVADARLSANVNLLDADQTVSGEKSYDKVVLNAETPITNNGDAVLDEPSKSVIILNGTTSVSVTTITATGVSTNRYIQLQNDTDNPFVVENGSGNIITGTGQNLELASKAVVILRYDGTNWRVVGGSGGGAGGIATEFYIHSALPATLSPDIRYIVDISGGDAAATMPASDALNDGKVIEVWPVNNPGGGEIVLTAAASHNFNDPDLGLDTEYVLDVSSSEFVIRDTGDLYEVRDAYWAAGFDLQEASASQSGVVTTGAQTFAGNKTFNDNLQLNAASNTTNLNIRANDNLTPTTPLRIENLSNTASASLGAYEATLSAGYRFNIGSSNNITIDSGGSFETANFNYSTTNQFNTGNTGLTTPALQIGKRGNNQETAGNYFVTFQAGGSNCGGIQSNGANTAAFFTLSDERLKVDITPLSSSLDKLMQLSPSSYRFKDKNNTQTGFIAQNMQSVFPEYVSSSVLEEGDAGNPEKNIEYLSIVGWDATTAHLVAAIQELKNELDATKAEVELLKNPN